MEVLPDPLGPAMIISSGLCSMLAIPYFIYAVGPFRLICYHFSSHIIKVPVGSFFIAFFSIFCHLAHNLRKHFICRLLTRTESIRIHFCF